MVTTYIFVQMWTFSSIWIQTLFQRLIGINGCVQNCREIEIVERWKWVSEIVERWKQVSEIVEKYFPVKSSSQNLREIEFVENMRVSFRNCREIWPQVSEIVEKGGFFQFVESRIKLLIGWARRWYAYEWLSHGHLIAEFDCILLCCFWFFTKELCIIIKIKVRECSFENQFTACHYKPGLVCFLPHFSLRVQLFFKRKKLQC